MQSYFMVSPFEFLFRTVISHSSTLEGDAVNNSCTHKELKPMKKLTPLESFPVFQDLLEV